MLKSIRKWLFYKSFAEPKKKTVQKNGVINPLRSICILFDGTDESERKLIHQFKKSISQNGRAEVKSLAFVNNRLPLDNVDYAAYNLKDVNWYGVPSGEKVNAFIKYDNDLMIVLCKKMLPHYEYIVAHTESQFIVGPSITRAENYFDLLVDVPKDNDTKELMKNVLNALNLVAVK